MPEKRDQKNNLEREKTHRQLMTERTRRLRSRFFYGLFLNGLGFSILIGTFVYISTLEVFKSIKDTPENDEIILFSFVAIAAIAWFFYDFIKKSLNIVYSGRRLRAIDQVTSMFFDLLYIIFMFGLAYQSFGVNVSYQEEVSREIFDTIYFSVITWTTIGYGDISPSGYSKIFSMLEGIIAFLCNSIFVAVLVKILLESDVRKESHK